VELIVELSGDRNMLERRMSAVKRLARNRPDLTLRIFIPSEYQPIGRHFLRGFDLVVASPSIKQAFDYMAEIEEPIVFVSAGNTTEIAFRAFTIIKTIYRKLRPILAVDMPKVDGHYILVDAGGSTKFTPQLAVWAALAGRIEARVRLNRESPRIGLLSIGEEPDKGGPEREKIRTYLEEFLGDSFVGNVEVQQVSNRDIDVLVSDGFTGNIALKATEAAFDLINEKVRYLCCQNSLFLPWAWLLKQLGRVFLADLNWRDYAAFALLGVRKPVYVAHGRSDERAFYTALIKATDPMTFEVRRRIEEDPQIKTVFHS